MAVGEVEEGEGAEGFAGLAGELGAVTSAVARKLCAARSRSTSL